MSGDGGEMWANLWALAHSIPRLEADNARLRQELAEARAENERLRKKLRNLFKGYLRDELKDGVLVQYLGVHALAWPKHPDKPKPTVGFTRWEDVEGFDETP